MTRFQSVYHIKLSYDFRINCTNHMDYLYWFLFPLWSLTAMNYLLYRKDSPQILLLCSTENITAWVNNDIKCIFGCTIPLSHSSHHIIFTMLTWFAQPCALGFIFAYFFLQLTLHLLDFSATVSFKCLMLFFKVNLHTFFYWKLNLLVASVTRASKSIKDLTVAAARILLTFWFMAFPSLLGLEYSALRCKIYSPIS